MALQKLTLKPGVNREGTSYANENGFYASDKVRFRSGYAEKIGGWKNIGTYTYEGVARSIWAWVSLTNEVLVGVGTSQKFYIEYGNKYYDVTPIRTTISATNIVTTAGSPQVSIDITNNQAVAGSFFTLTKAYGTLGATIDYTALTITASGVTGTFPASGTILIDNEQINYSSISGPVSGIYTFTIPATDGRGVNATFATGHLAGATIISLEAITVGGVNFVGEQQAITVSTNSLTFNTTSTTTAGSSAGPFYAIFQINAGGSTFTTDNGWGSGGWGINSWGAGSITSTLAPLRLWSETNFDQDLMFAYREGPIYWWTKNTTAFPRAITINDQANTIPKTVKTGTWLSGGSSVTINNGDVSGINFGAVVVGNGIPAGAYVDPQWDQSDIIPLLDTTGTPAIFTAAGTSATVSFSYSGRHIPVKTMLVAISSSNAFTIAFGATPYNPRVFSDAANFDPLLVRWSDQDQPYDWVPEITNQSGEQRLANGSKIITAVNTRQEILIWTDTAIYSMQYLGPPYVFGINLLMDNLSIASQNAAITVNNVTYWMGVDRFYSYSGRVETLPCTLRQYIFGRINRSQLAQVCCGTNEGFNEIWWFYPSGNSTVNDSYVIYNHLEQTWVYGTMNRTAWLDTQLEQNPLGAFSTERTYISAAIGTTDTSISIAEGASLPSSGTITIDSEQITYTTNDYANNLLTGCIRGVNSTTAAPHAQYARLTFTTPNQLMYHEYGYDDGSNTVTLPIEAYIESADFDIEDGLNFSYVWRILPDLSFDGSTVTNPKCYLTVKVRQNSGSAYSIDPSDPVNDPYDAQAVYRTATSPVEQYTGQVYVRVRGRQMAFKMESRDLGVFWQMGMMRIDLKPDGRR